MSDVLIYKTEEPQTLELVYVEGGVSANLGFLRALPAFQNSPNYSDSVMADTIKSISSVVEDAFDIAGKLIPEAEADLGETTADLLNGSTQMMSAMLTMQGVGFLKAGMWTRRIWDGTTYQTYSFQTRLDHAGFNSLIRSPFMSAVYPSEISANTFKNLFESLGDALKISSFISTDGKQSYTSFALNELLGQLKAGFTEGITTIGGSKGIMGLTKLAETLKGANEESKKNQAKAIEQLFVNITGYDLKTAETLAKEKLGITDALTLDKKLVEKGKAMGAIGGNKLFNAVDDTIDKVNDILSSILGEIASFSSVAQPRQIRPSSIKILYGSTQNVTRKIVPLPSEGGKIYKSQNLVVDSFTATPSDSLTRKDGSLVPVWYDVDITMSTTMTPVNRFRY